MHAHFLYAAAVIGFDSTEIEVTKRPFPQSVPVCLNIAEEPARAYDTYLIVNTHSGLAGIWKIMLTFITHSLN